MLNSDNIYNYTNKKKRFAKANVCSFFKQTYTKAHEVQMMRRNIHPLDFSQNNVRR